MINKEDIDAMSPDPETLEVCSVKLDDITVEFNKPVSTADTKYPYSISALNGSMGWFTRDGLIDRQKRMNTAIRLVLERTGKK